MNNAAALIEHLGLTPLPHEGGYFARTWTSREQLPAGRPAGTAIYFLLTPESFSALHRLDADELWHFHAGDPVQHVQFTTDSAPCITTLGTDFSSRQSPQLCVRAGVWQGARLITPARQGWALLGCTMTPGWSERGFELGQRSVLLTAHPLDSSLIRSFTRIS